MNPWSFAQVRPFNSACGPRPASMRMTDATGATGGGPAGTGSAGVAVGDGVGEDVGEDVGADAGEGVGKGVGKGVGEGVAGAPARAFAVYAANADAVIGEIEAIGPTGADANAKS